MAPLLFFPLLSAPSTSRERRFSGAPSCCCSATRFPGFAALAAGAGIIFLAQRSVATIGVDAAESYALRIRQQLGGSGAEVLFVAEHVLAQGWVRDYVCPTLIYLLLLSN